MPKEPLTCRYPPSALIGMDNVITALECAFVNPAIHTVLLCGGQGTGKSVAARSTATLTSKNIINCPAGISEEQLFGTIDIGRTIKEGIAISNDGLLKRADKNILYIDDVNLMENSTLASIFDSVLTGEIRIERGKISTKQRLDTILIATMNPDERDLDSHILDRFDICINIRQLDESDRKEMLRRTAQFSNDPIGFTDLYHKEEEALKSNIERSMTILPSVSVSDELISIVAELCIRMGTDGSRGDLAVAKCSIALAALNGRDEVTRKDVEEAAIMCLSHRRNECPQPPRPNNDKKQDEKKDDDDKDANEDDWNASEENHDEQSEKENDENMSDSPNKLPDIEDMVFDIGEQFRVIDYIDNGGRLPSRTKTRKGRRSIAESSDATGRCARARIPTGEPADIAFDATIMAAAPYQRNRMNNGLSIAIEKQDLREKVRERRSGCTLFFVVDASGSLGVKKRMMTVKGAILSMLRQSYLKRDSIGLMAFRRDSMEVILPPTKSVEYGYKKLEELPTGGRTPLGLALEKIATYMTTYRRCHPGERCFVILVTDGRANVPIKNGADANKEVREIAKKINVPGIQWIVVDASMKYSYFDDAKILANDLNGRYFKLEDLNADYFAKCIKTTIDS